MNSILIKICSIPRLLIISGLLFSFQVYANEKTSDDIKLDKPHKNTMSTAELFNTYWKLTEIDGEPVVTMPGQREMKLTLHVEENKVNGFGGCNSFFGTFTHDVGTIKFGPLAATRKFCAESMDQESQFFKLLSEVANYTITGQVLLFNDDDGKPVLKLEAVYLK